ncbi:multisubunit sodium/proton antiporter, MrpF subunit (TC 2.A.63.1) [Saccharopolyspora kobensis]|uniref:Multisubunit sodium/proton antiporter, MrpF subunit n=1 Tax=Saccharopolyspora kobensis TaxID=146035 RepID=A0A1H6ECE4_9PSEU|nr:monovalent cation/H+ antiporter complex subunit F [Saccharopolyspora kobensis]SEG94626.1 multisubunit sodium/proton antiporter, MrpF subunit (TC 2.A.63.1) [Saccharopolyspora kobensis]SFD63992.1 multisubunit sodium/proton antiporter, MrpF subunit [Saccharopolyspora kobensis]
MTWVFIVTVGLLSVAGLLVLVRLILGRTTLDRIVAVDVFVTVIIAGTCAGMGWVQDGSNIALLAAFALLAFIGSVSAARLVEKKEPYR